VVGLVTCASTPGVLRVVYTAYEDETDKREAVCFLRPTDTGQIDILYSHHTDYQRPSDKGPWQVTDFKMVLSPALMAEISSNVMHEFWNAFGCRIRDLPKGMDVPAPYIDFGGVTKFHAKHVK
jgi:hypothetical protein